MKKKRILATTLAAAMLLSMAAPTAYAEDIVVGATAVETHEAAAPVETETAEAAVDTYNAADVPINENTFPDATFRQYVLDNFDKDDNESLSATEISNAKEVSISNKSISTLKGIEYLTAVTKLACERNQLTSLDVSNCTALTDLLCEGNLLSRLDVSKNIALTNLICHSNKLTGLDVSKNVMLTSLSCGGNMLTDLDVSKNTALTDFSCVGNQLTSLDVSKNTALTRLYCGSNQLTSLDVSKNTALTSLSCVGNQLTSLDVSKNTALTYLYCGGNQLTSLDVSKNAALTYLDCRSNQLTSLDVSGHTALTDLLCENNILTSLDASNNAVLTFLTCYNNQLTSLDVSKSTALTNLSCVENQLTNLDVSQNTALTTLTCSSNQLTSLDVSNNTALKDLFCKNNCLPTLNLENNKELDIDVSCYSPQTIMNSGTVDVATLVGQDNLDRVSDIKTLDDGVEYYYDVKGTYSDGTAMPKMLVSVKVASPATATPAPQTTTSPDQPQSTATPTPATSTTTPEPSTSTEPDATPEPTTPANPDDNNTGTGDNNDNTNTGTDTTPETPSTEGTTGFVDRLYSVCLGREADAAGQADWVKQLTSYQISGTKAAYGFIFSEEFTNMNYSNADFVERLYEAFMGRASDEGGKADWVSKLDAGTSREEVFNGFANSVEFDNICKSYGIVSKDIETFVTRLYSVCLDRQPDDAGLADWANQLRSQTISGKAAASGFVFSEEFTNKNYSNADYVEHLYAAFMGRASDEGGKADWVGKLDAGTSREEVFNGFADSAEFDAICSGYGIVRG